VPLETFRDGPNRFRDHPGLHRRNHRGGGCLCCPPAASRGGSHSSPPPEGEVPGGFAEGGGGSLVIAPCTADRDGQGAGAPSVLGPKPPSPPPPPGAVALPLCTGAILRFLVLHRLPGEVGSPALRRGRRGRSPQDCRHSKAFRLLPPYLPAPQSLRRQGPSPRRSGGGTTHSAPVDVLRHSPRRRKRTVPPESGRASGCDNEGRHRNSLMVPNAAQHFEGRAAHRDGRTYPQR
jgi:hypothetical protein